VQGLADNSGVGRLFLQSKTQNESVNHHRNKIRADSNVKESAENILSYGIEHYIIKLLG